jgi:hypothetical protein
MGTFPPAVSPQGAPPQGAGAPSGAMLGQLIQGLATQFPQAQQGIKMMLDGLRQVQASASSQSSPPQPAAPPR